MSPRFAVGDRVKVRMMTPPGHVRTPFFARGKVGEVIAIAGSFKDPEQLAYGRKSETRALYRVRFAQKDVWPDYRGDTGDGLIVDIYEHWLDNAHG